MEIKIKKLMDKESAPFELFLKADPSLELIKHYLEQGECFLASISQKVVGGYILLPTSSETVEIMNLAVKEEYQRKGIGRKLIMHAIHEAKEQHFTQIEIGTGNSSIGQLALYQKCGFRITDVVLDFFVKNYPEAIFENGIQCRDMIRLVQKIEPMKGQGSKHDCRI